MTKTILYAIAAALIAVTTLAVAAPTQQPELAGRGGGAAPHSGPRVYRFDQTILVGASERSFTLNLPPTYYDSSARVPLVIALHGGGGSGAQFEATSGLTQKADAARVAVVYPDGTAGALGLRSWNGGGCCGHAVAADIDDVEFMRQLIAHLTANYRIDRKRVYAAGHSNGGILAYRLACELPERIAAIAANAAAMMVDSCAPAHAVPLLHMHSRLDANVPIGGGQGIGLAGVTFPSLASVMQSWVAIDACKTPPIVRIKSGLYERTTWRRCSDRAALDLYVTDDGGHAWPGGLPGGARGDTPSEAIDANDLLLAFFRRHALP